LKLHTSCQVQLIHSHMCYSSLSPRKLFLLSVLSVQQWAVQATAELYEYPCKRFPDSIRNRADPPAPTASEVCSYLDEYIDDKKMRPNFHFNRTVTGVTCNKAEDDWVVHLEGDSAPHHFTFVVVCTGLVSVKPKMVHLPGSAAFVKHGGLILHSSERRAGVDATLGGKRVLVIGNGKSAVDAAAAAAEAVMKAPAAGTGSAPAKPPIQLARRQIWYVPRYILGFLQYKWAFHTRLGSLLQPAYYETPTVFRFLHLLFSPVKWMLWRVVEILLLCQYRLPYRLWPAPLTIESAALETSILITDEAHLRRLRSGEVDMRIGTVTRLKPGRAVLSDGTEEEVDVIVQATGWAPGYVTILDPDHLVEGCGFANDGLDVCSDGLWLYRNVLPAGFRGLAFVGANTLTFINIYTSYVQAYWLAQLLANDRPWPEREHMAATVEREKAFKRRLYPNGTMRGASVELYMQDYHDVLFSEMKARRPFPRWARPLADLVVPVVPYVMGGCLEPLPRTDVEGTASTAGEKAPLMKNGNVGKTSADQAQ
jgi:cation diffusion facilitator CzcD-associated flavoprotein CzcO